MDPTDPDRLQKHAVRATNAALHGTSVRGKYRRRYKPASKRRQDAIRAAIDRIDESMKLVRSDIGLLQWNYVPDEIADALRSASAACQAERRKLKKMLGREVIVEEPDDAA
jgi:hypothetical protein